MSHVGPCLSLSTSTALIVVHLDNYSGLFTGLVAFKVDFPSSILYTDARMMYQNVNLTTPLPYLGSFNGSLPPAGRCNAPLHSIQGFDHNQNITYLSCVISCPFYLSLFAQVALPASYL